MSPRALLPAAALLLGCRASVVELRKPVRGPVEEVGVIDWGGGRLRYALKGSSLLVMRRRADAMKRAAKFCGGRDRAVVDEEFDQEDVETPYYAQDLEFSLKNSEEHYRVERYRHILFRCLGPGAPKAGP